jgi:predicted Zn finger-like uncharacterized protein
MKINCQSCGAKYTIADEKVRGKTVKIRCKKCGAAIVVRGGEAPPDRGVDEEEDDATRGYPHADGQPSSAATSMEWTLNMPDGDQRAVSVEEIGQLFASGAINGETYAWRDGMADWQPLNQIAELAPVLASPVPRPSAAPAPDPRLAGKLLGGGEAGPARVAARRPERAKDHDLFGSAQNAGSDEEIAARAASSPSAAPAPKHTFTAERGENSVLFSVEAIRAAAKPQTKRPPADDDKVDFSAIASNIPPPMDTSAGGGYDEVLNSPPSFPSFGGPMLAAPTLPTSIEPEPPPPPDPAVAAADDLAMAPAKSNKGLVIGLAAAVGVLAVIALAFGGYVLFSRTPPADTTSSALSATTASAAPGAAPDTTAAAAPDAAAQEPSAAATTDTADAGPARPAAPGTTAKGDSTREPKPESTKKDEPKKDDKKDDKKDEAKDTPAPAADTAAGGGAPFSRSAAVSALNAAAGAASGCKKPDGPTGRGRVSVTFAPSGKVSSAVVEGPPFAGTSVGGCVAAAFRRATVPPFTGSPVTVHKSFTIE